HREILYVVVGVRPERLKIGHDAERGEARNVGRVEELDVRDDVARPPDNTAGSGVLARESVQGDANGTVADGMDVHLESRGVQLLHQRVELRGSQVGLAPVTRT